MLKLLEILFCGYKCKHEHETEICFKDVNGNICLIGFCCKCGVLRHFERFDKGIPPISNRPSKMQFGAIIGEAKYIEKHPASGSYKSQPVFEDD